MFLVLDIGGHTTELSFLTPFKGLYQVEYSKVYTNLGGNLVNMILEDFLISEFKATYNIDPNISVSKTKLLELGAKVEQMKRSMNFMHKVPISVENFSNEQNLSVTVTREVYDNLLESFHMKVISQPIQDLLSISRYSNIFEKYHVRIISWKT